MTPREEKRKEIAARKRAKRAHKPRKCSTCKQVKTSAEFQAHSGNSSGLATTCNDCRNGINTRRRHTDVNARVKHMICTRATKQVSSVPLGFNRNIETYLGYTIPELTKTLDEQCRSDYNIGLLDAINSGDYHIDHIKALSSFDVDDPEGQTFRDCWAISNLCVITAEENLKKGAKDITYEELRKMGDINA